MAQPPRLTIPFERNNNTTATYPEVVGFYKALASQYEQLELKTAGDTDSGFPLHIAVLSKDQDFSPASLREKGKHIIFINNAIHPGEPCGVDATMLLIRDYLQEEELQKYLEDVVLVVIPFYNISGGLNRGSYSRANQLGPEAHGFRGNARNLDLNRDFIKCDSKNARSFNQLFTEWQPGIFIDHHTSNGADYQYTMTLIATQHNKLDTHLAEYLQRQLLPGLYRDMESRGWEMTPYVYARGTPDKGIAGFLDLPRYSSGYAALHNAVSFITETHMLKPYSDRVMSTYAFMDVMIKTLHQEGEKLAAARDKAIRNTIQKDSFDINWRMDRSQWDSILFKGYEAGYKPSEVSGLDRLYYDRTKPFEKLIPHYNYYQTTKKVRKPAAYIIPQAYEEVMKCLQWNGVKMSRLKKDTSLQVEMYYIKDYQTSRYAYEGHYLHSEVEVEKKLMEWNFYKGDYIVLTDQPANRYIVETLEPEGPDSFFAWNFFDGILMRKEYFSSYVFEDLAADLLRENPDLKEQLEKKKAEDEEFAGSASGQLNFIYQRSPYYEPTHNLYPVGRLRGLEGIRQSLDGI